MKIGITHKLFFSIMGATALAVFSSLFITLWSIDRGFYQFFGKLGEDRLRAVATDLRHAYEQHGSWDFLKKDPPRIDIAPRWEISGIKASSAQIAPRFTKPPGGSGDRHSTSDMLEDEQPGGPLIILNADRQPVLGSYQQNDKINFLPINMQSQTVGFVGLLPPKHSLVPMQVSFLAHQKYAVALGAIGIVALVIVISLPLARRLVSPITAMTGATHNIALGRYTTRIPVMSSDELGQLARDFNAMALTLEQHEKERRQWVADISHELRTPVAVLQGEIEQLQDGIVSVTPDTIRSLHEETLRLKRLVEDLYQLSLADSGVLTYKKERLDLVGVLSSSMENFRAEFARKDISINFNAVTFAKLPIIADRGRLEQLFGNLFENSLRYTDPHGQMTVSLSTAHNGITIDFQDSKPGVSEQELEKLFDRFYRVERSRNRVSGGAGLGLAISRQIVEAHGGTISAHSSSLGGLRIKITLPLEEDSRE